MSGLGTLYNSLSRWCADLPNNGSEHDVFVYEHDCDITTGDNQLFSLEETGYDYRYNGTTYRTSVIRNYWSGQCMDLPGTGSVTQGTQVWMHNCNTTPSDNQRWFFVPAGDVVYGVQNYLVRNVASDLCLDVDGWGGEQNGRPLTVYPCWGSGWPNGGYDDHLWHKQAPHF